MSSATPNKRLQLKTSDLADFFRGSSTGLSSTNSGRSTTLIDENRLSTSSSPSRKRSTRIPFIGRPRKKSVHSDVAPSVASEARESRSSVATGSGSILEQPNSVVALHASTSQHSLHSTSLGSKIVARFTPSKSRSSSKPQSRKSQLSAKTQEELSDYTSDSLVSPSLAPRSPSIDSKFSRVSRSSTPRASQANEKASGGGGLHPQPTITVSRPPVDNLDNMDQYEDLFTKPPRRIKQKPVPVDTRPLASLSREPPLRDTLCPSPPPSAISLATPTISRTPSVSARAPAPTAADIIRRSATISRMHKLSYSPAPSPSDSNNVPIPGSSSSIRRGDSLIGTYQDSDIDPAEESEAMSVKSAMSMPASFRSSVNRSTVAGAHGKPRPFTTSYTLKGSRMLQPSKPPSIPLPSTPSSSSNETPTARPRAHTISSSRLARSSSSSPKDNPQKRHSIVSKTVGRSSPLSKDPATPLRSTNSSSSSSSSSSTPTLTKTVPSSEAGQIGIDIDSASVDELRKALRLRNQQFDKLSNQLIEVMAAHTAEKSMWENKVAELEKELSRKQSEIKGLSWIVKNEEYDPSSTMQSGSRTPSLLERERSDDSSTRSSIPTPSSFVRLPLHQLRQGEDSGAESNPTSQSEWGSGTSGAEDDLYMAAMKPKRAMRRLKLVESVNKAMYPASVKQPGSGAGSDTSEMVSDGPYLGKPNKRSSTSSSFTAASSSPPTSPEPTSVNFPSQNLNPIPESRPSSVVPGSREEHKRERRPSRISFGSLGQPSAASKSQSKSIPSVTTGSRLTPSEAYVRTLQKGRPPSIAQVLDQGKKVEQPAMNSIEESYGGRSRAILAGLNSPAGRK